MLKFIQLNITFKKSKNKKFDIENNIQSLNLLNKKLLFDSLCVLLLFIFVMIRTKIQPFLTSHLMFQYSLYNT